jgi:hypothetical protein
MGDFYDACPHCLKGIDAGNDVPDCDPFACECGRLIQWETEYMSDEIGWVAWLVKAERAEANAKGGE